MRISFVTIIAKMRSCVIPGRKKKQNPCLPAHLTPFNLSCLLCASICLYLFRFHTPLRVVPFFTRFQNLDPPHHSQPHHRHQQSFELGIALRLLCFPWPPLFVFISVSLFVGFVCHFKKCVFFFVFQNSIVDGRSAFGKKSNQPPKVKVLSPLPTSSSTSPAANNVLVSSGSSILAPPGILSPSCAFRCQQIMVEILTQICLPAFFYPEGCFPFKTWKFLKFVIF